MTSSHWDAGDLDAGDLQVARELSFNRLSRALAAEELVAPHALEGLVAEAGADPLELFDAAVAAISASETLEPGQVARARAELSDSEIGLARARAAVRGAARAGRDLADFEQSVWSGHWLHPMAKTSLGLRPEDYQYLPEAGQEIPLHFVAVSADQVHTHGVGILDALAATVPNLAAALGELLAAGELPIPVHPAQLPHLKERYAAEFAAGTYRQLPLVVPARPLMSVRTLAVRDLTGPGRVHIKTAISAQLTGAIRGVSYDSTVAGPAMSRLINRILDIDAALTPKLAGDQGESVPAFAVAQDLSGVSVAKRADFGAIVRQDPCADFVDETGELAADIQVLPVAALNNAQEPALAGLPRPQVDPGEFMRALLPAAVMLVERWGIAIEPHPQNTLVVLKRGRLHRVIVRDLGGSRLLAGGKAATWLGSDLGPMVAEKLQGSAIVATDEQAVRDKVRYPLLVNLCGYLGAAEFLPTAAKELINLEYQFGLDLSSWYADPAPYKTMLHMRLVAKVTDQEYRMIPNPLAPYAEAAAAAHLPSEEELGRARVDVEKKIAAARALESGAHPSEADVENAAWNLAWVRHRVAARRRELPANIWDTLQRYPRDFAAAVADSLTTEGHNVHPLAKLRRGWSRQDSLRYGCENGRPVELRFIAVPTRETATTPYPFEQALAERFPEHLAIARAELATLVADPSEWTITLVHPWQLDNRLTENGRRVLHPGAAGSDDQWLELTQVRLAALPLVSNRSLIAYGGTAHPVVKVSVGAVFTSTIRNMSSDSALGTPAAAQAIANLCAQLDREHPLPGGLTLKVQPEIAGLCQADLGQRDISVLLRDNVFAGEPSDRPGPLAVGVSALAAAGSDGTPLAAMIAGPWLARYAAALTEVSYRLFREHQVVVEAHAQNTMVLIDAHRSFRGIVLRDFSGIRVLPGSPVPVRPGAITATAAEDEAIKKLRYVILLGNLAAVASFLGGSEEVFAELRSGILSSGKAEFLVPTLAKKAFLEMNVADSGDRYVTVDNPFA